MTNTRRNITQLAKHPVKGVNCDMHGNPLGNELSRCAWTGKGGVVHPVKGVNCDMHGNPLGNETDEQIMTNTRRNITQPADWWAAFDRAVEASGMDLSAWLGEAGRRMLPRDERKKLSERATRGRPAKTE